MNYSTNDIQIFLNQTAKFQELFILYNSTSIKPQEIIDKTDDKRTKYENFNYLGEYENSFKDIGNH